MKKIESRYEARGVSSEKKDVHNAIKHLGKGIFPGAFCKILPDILARDKNWCNLQHADGAGTKAGLAYLVWKLTGDLDVWKNVIRDSLFMNLDDAGCVGAVGPFLISLSIDRNQARISGKVISALIQGCQEVCDEMTALGIPCHLTGGETADVGDLVRTITVNNTITVRFKRSKIIDASKICAPGIIVGFSSTGQATWETVPNSGMGSNGLTSARHDILDKSYRSHTETYAPETDPKLIYCGEYLLTNLLPGDPRFTIASALLSPTRTYLPLIARLCKRLGPEKIMGLIHCSGGGQTKIGKFGHRGITFRKDNLFPVPPLFKMLQSVRGLSFREAYQTYNMGHRLEAVVPARHIADECIKIADGCGIDARIIGSIDDQRPNKNKRRVIISSGMNSESYLFS